MTISADRGWIVANNTEKTNVTVILKNATNVPVKNALVTFSLTGYAPYSVSPYSGSSSDFGTLTNITATTDENGMVLTTFKTKTKSGAVRISSSASYTDVDGFTYFSEGNTTVNIDHDRPYIPIFSYPSSGTVATVVPFNVSITDRWGNIIDNRNTAEVHILGLHVNGPSPDDCGFQNGASYTHDYYPSLDAYGNLTAYVKLTTKAGHNNIVSDRMGDNLGAVPILVNWIDAETWGTPYSISLVSLEPTPPEIPADGLASHVYTIQYLLTDKYGNPAGSQQVWVNTTLPGENRLYTSNSLGQVWIAYGPKSVTGHITINATPVANDSISSSCIVGFYNTTAVDMDITANPESMASYDVDSSITGQVIAKVMDVMGNPVAGENVTFTLGTPSYDGSYTITSSPYITDTAGITKGYAYTDGDGNAVINFHPGGFTTNTFDSKYSQTATGNVTVTATWNAQVKKILLTWKNYPYLSVKTSASPQQVAINDSIRVNIQLIGDGWALQPRPVDVVLVTDTSGSMGYESNKKINAAKAADKAFVGKMTGQDRVGLVQYGIYDVAQVDLNFTTCQTTMISKINGYSAHSSTPMRAAIFYADQMLIKYGRANAVKAIVLLTDGVWNTGGDPEAIAYMAPDGNGPYTPVSFTNPTVSSSGSVINLAKNNGILIYTVGLGADVNDSILNRYAYTTGGTYYSDPTNDQTQLENIYIDIAGKLKEVAGVNAAVEMKFKNVSVNGVTVPGAQVFNYTYKSFNGTNYGEASTLIGWQDGVYNDTNQRGQWVTSQSLSFGNIGNISIGQQWNATFNLVVNKSGTIDVFGNESIITFNSGASSLRIPHTYITAVNELTSTGTHMKSIVLSSYTCTAPVGGLIPCQWVTTYDGTQSVSEEVFYSNDNGLRWIQFDAKTNLVSGGGTTTQFSQLDVSDLPPGGYQFKVKALALDAPNTELVSNSVSNLERGKSFIKLE